MVVAVIRSRNIQLTDAQIASSLPEQATKLLSGGAVGVDRCVRRYAMEHKIPFTEFLPQYKRFGKAAPCVRNAEMLQHADMVIAFWNGVSKGTGHGIRFCEKSSIPICVITTSI